LGAVESRLKTDLFGGGELMVRKPPAPAMSKEAMRQESERLVREAMARNVTITQGKTQLGVKCSKCGAPNRVSAEVGHSRVEYACKECGHNKRPCDQKSRWVFGHSCGRCASSRCRSRREGCINRNSGPGDFRTRVAGEAAVWQVRHSRRRPNWIERRDSPRGTRRR